jgi:hypothetical protein
MDSSLMNTSNINYVKYIVENCGVSVATAKTIADTIIRNSIKLVNPDDEIQEEHEDVLLNLSELSKLSGHYNKELFVKQAFQDYNRWEYYENKEEDEEFVSYLERVAYLVSQGIKLSYVFEYADDYRNIEDLHQLISLIERGATTESAWLMTNDFTSNQIDEFFEYVECGFDQNYAFQCTNEFHNIRFKKNLVIRLFQSGMPDEVAFEIVFRFTNDINMIQSLLFLIEKNIPIQELMNNLENIDENLVTTVSDRVFMDFD